MAPNLWEHIFVHSGAGTLYVKLPPGLRFFGISRLSETAGTVYYHEGQTTTGITVPNDAKMMVNSACKPSEFFPQLTSKNGIISSTVAAAATVKVIVWVGNNPPQYLKR